MGSGIAQVAATAGHGVVVYDNSQVALEKAKSSLGAALKKLVEKQKLTQASAAEITGRIIFVNDLKSLKDCGLIIEAIVENVDVKQAVFKELETVVPASCAIASNTSSLSITSIAAGCNKPERILGIHFFNPAPLMPLVEVIPGIATDQKVLQESKKLIDSWGKSTVLAKDTPGFIVNRIARPFYGEAIRIYEEGIADMVTIDWAMKAIGGFKMGPFELMDLIGNDVNYTVTETVWKQFFYDPRYQPSLTQKRLFEAKQFGRKSGRGYYDYSEGAVMPEPKKDKTLGEQVFMRVLSMLINEAVNALYLNIATKEDLDTAMTKGVNYPKGLLKWCDEIGADRILETLTALREEYGEDRYRPVVLLKKVVKENKKFH